MNKSKIDTFKRSPIRVRNVAIEILSSHSKVSVTVGGTTVLDDSNEKTGRGIHVVVLNEVTASVMAYRNFDTYVRGEDVFLLEFLRDISNGRIIILAIKDEGSFSLGNETRAYIKSLGSIHAPNLRWRDMWSLVAAKNRNVIGEGMNASPQLSSWGEPLFLNAQMILEETREVCHWSGNDADRRKNFCDKLEGYSEVCNCNKPVSISFDPEELEEDNLQNVPVVLIASNRPYYLYRTLRRLLSTKGVRKKNVIVFIDGYFQAPLEVCQLFDVQGIQHTPIGQKNARIHQHYKASLTATFNLFPSAQFALILEEDLLVAQDFFSYFSQTIHLLKDEDIYCISAWNDQGYEHSCQDPSLLYRVETMPGLGWLLSRNLYKQELEPSWPSAEQKWDWDMWMRTERIRKGRECIIPDVSRTYHFGSKGLNMNSYFQKRYFENHALNKHTNVRLHEVNSLKKAEYEQTMENLIQYATVLDKPFTCSEDYIPNTTRQTYVVYFEWLTKKEWSSWKTLAKCFHLWDIDLRGVHRGAIRIFLKKNHIIFVGVPLSPYSKFKPKALKPISIQESTVKT
ncbi:unnamed protein product [Dimorphilus gyrociliatus]|uniref:Alpha-1,3-mannosyl-glycoprotein 2-beta-N-acetylglucosaminyltransferase n=1 Tax=Dimorphilus gyrociliatus TaxID=2664684 RepID=A0A7I8VND3_9ANNE|nr:unnamed protein product [Dimorphilus gyrociliatus]